MIEDIKERIINFVFIVSEQPILFRDLLQANSLNQQKMYVDPSKLGFRLKLNRTYLVFAIFVVAFTVVFTGITHGIFRKIDSHLSILIASAITAAVFVLFNTFRDWLLEVMTKRRIKQAWKLHFPFFPYEEYGVTVANLYNEAIKNEVPKKDLELYIINKLSN